MESAIGIMFTAGTDLQPTLKEIGALGIRHGQMAIPGDLALDGAAEKWGSALSRSGFALHTLFGVYTGESYKDIPTVQRTVGFMPQATRGERERRTYEIIELAASLGVPGIATHIGFVPDDTRHPDYLSMVELVRRIADAAARHGITFALETGQETASALLDLLIEVNRDNVGVNFDPANMILYGAGDPIEALDIVGQHLITVHCKDGVWPRADVPGSLGIEKPIGEGSVNFPAFLALLRKFGYRKPLFIEREAEDHATRLRDIRTAKIYLEALALEEI
jgi:sugar phosphate isomerase/epimerase